MKTIPFAKTLLILNLILVTYAVYLISCTATRSTSQTCKGDPNLNSICVDNISYALDTSGSGTGCGPRCKLLIINNKRYATSTKDSDTSFLRALPKTVELNGNTFELADYEKAGTQMLDSKWLIINNRLYQRKK